MVQFITLQTSNMFSRNSNKNRESYNGKVRFSDLALKCSHVFKRTKMEPNFNYLSNELLSKPKFDDRLTDARELKM